MLVNDHSPESPPCPVIHAEQFGQQDEEGILPLCSSLMRHHPECCVQVWSSQHWNGTGLLEHVRGKDRKYDQRAVPPLCEQRLKELGLLRLPRDEMGASSLQIFEVMLDRALSNLSYSKMLNDANCRVLN